MPGILPMKVIKVGNSSQSRIAQACDRCRSKKIRCDGVRPTCTQCANVGFECRTSDKLSRRAFPRGYTESLEERVRVLEGEVRELKDLLDEKDEKIDMLSKMHGNHHHQSPHRQPSISHSPSASPDSRKDSPPAKEDTFRIQASPLLLGVENSDSYFMGPSSGRAFIEAFKRKMQETGKQCTDFHPEAFLHIQGTPPLVTGAVDQTFTVPPRLFSDRCVNVYFQEWAPLFPVLHKPTFLHVYEDFVADPAKIKCNYKTAQLYLVFSIAGLSSENPDMQQVATCEYQWLKALDMILMENTMGTLQCLILALIYCTMRADYKRLQHYKGIAVGLSHRLGLHQSQKRFSFGALTIETRKKVFWTLYTLDCFTAATLGLPKLLKEEDVQAEYPTDTDDEYVTEKGFQPTLPGEFTRLSSALALFRATRILARVLEKIYPATSTHELSLQQMEALEADLEAWYRELPGHLRLNFVQDKPSTDVTGSRSPLLALAYNFIRTLIWRPAVGSALGQKAAPALMAIADSSKHTIQIVQLLEERNMNFSFCLNKTDLLITCGMTLLYQVIDLKPDSRIMREYERLINSVIKIVERPKAPGSWDFKRVAGKLIAVDEPLASSPAIQTSPREASMPAPSQRASPSVAHLRQPSVYSPLGRHPEASQSESDLHDHHERARRMTLPSAAGQRPDFYSSPRPSTEIPENAMAQQSQRVSNPSKSSKRRQSSSTATSRHNLDYLSLKTTQNESRPISPSRNRMHPPATMPQQGHPAMINGQLPVKMTSPASSAEWEVLLGQMDGGLNNVYDAIYGGQSFHADVPVSTGAQQPSDWSPDSWDLTSFNIGDYGTGPAAPQSVLSLSDESLTSGEDVAPSELGLSMGSVDYGNNMMSANTTNNEGYILDNLNGF
ncbi:unnamed protein product [Clonostachys rhizophaga]|uniref:Zn(2)-C6 fungal-type domain-containing protein n=1 Tax=Clonostachys rhizophaga TaxID=160324 RepID=A0A9N9YE30_9HYPO|nr:unnamed protein product [Clonostachys rhizophaga]